MVVGSGLCEIRIKNGICQEDLAKATGFSSRTIRRIEKGETSPSSEFMFRMSAYFHMAVEELFEMKE